MTYNLTGTAQLIVEEPQISLLKDYTSWKQPKISETLNIDQLDYFITQIKNEFRKTNYTDKTFDKQTHQEKVLSYFKSKIAAELQFNSEHQNAFKFIDLFCGAGGLSIGLEQAGLVSDLALDKDKSSLLTYHFNRPYLKDEQIINDDIREVTKEYEFKKTPLVVGGPPCQGFSNANKQRKENDDRNQLYKFYVHTVELSSPDVFLLENVEGILEHVKEIQKDFAKIKYTLYPYRLNTKDFGFPQNRKRVFILGISDKHEKISFELQNMFNSTIQSEKGKVNFTLWDSISDLPNLKAKTERNSTHSESKDWGFTFGDFRANTSVYSNFINPTKNLETPLLNHKSKFNNERDIEIYGLLKQGEGSDSESIADINPYLNREDIFKDKFFKLLPNEPSKTITAHMYYDCHMYIHPFAARGLTPREAARVQGFPDDYFFLGSPNEWYRQIGNAVSPILGRILGKALNKVLNRIYEF
jgi:DNA (cytosine-5)-methyltransferase 1